MLSTDDSCLKPLRKFMQEVVARKEEQCFQNQPELRGHWLLKQKSDQISETHYPLKNEFCGLQIFDRVQEFPLSLL